MVLGQLNKQFFSLPKPLSYRRRKKKQREKQSISLESISPPSVSLLQQSIMVFIANYLALAFLILDIVLPNNMEDTPKNHISKERDTEQRIFLLN